MPEGAFLSINQPSNHPTIRPTNLTNQLTKPTNRQVRDEATDGRLHAEPMFCFETAGEAYHMRAVLGSGCPLVRLHHPT